MGLSLKAAEMNQFLESIKVPGENFKCMLWGTVTSTDLHSFQNRSAASAIMFFAGVPGAAGSLSNCFCYIGVTEYSLYVVALDAYNTSKIVGSFNLPYAHITSLKVFKTAFGASHSIDIECGGFVNLTVKSTSIGTDIKDQKQRMELFLATMELWKK